MFLPIGDDNRDRHLTPVVNYILIALNLIVYIFFQEWGNNLAFTYSYSTVPEEILRGVDIVSESYVEEHPITGQRILIPGLGKADIPVYLTLISSMFMHGGLAHLGGNMLFLWVFGDNIENDLGHRNYFIFYLLSGILAALAHVFSTAFFSQDTLIPSLGASGAISGVLGAYMIMHPRRSVHLWVFITIISVPAIIAVGLWFVFQVVNGLGSLGGQEAGGIAYAAHIGGFIAGLIIIFFFPKIKPKPKREIYWGDR